MLFWATASPLHYSRLQVRVVQHAWWLGAAKPWALSSNSSVKASGSSWAITGSAHWLDHAPNHLPVLRLGPKQSLEALPLLNGHRKFLVLALEVIGKCLEEFSDWFTLRSVFCSSILGLGTRVMPLYAGAMKITLFSLFSDFLYTPTCTTRVGEHSSFSCYWPSETYTENCILLDSQELDTGVASHITCWFNQTPRHSHLMLIHTLGATDAHKLDRVAPTLWGGIA